MWYFPVNHRDSSLCSLDGLWCTHGDNKAVEFLRKTECAVYHNAWDELSTLVYSPVAVYVAPFKLGFVARQKRPGQPHFFKCIRCMSPQPNILDRISYKPQKIGAFLTSGRLFTTRSRLRHTTPSHVHETQHESGYRHAQLHTLHLYADAYVYI